MVINYNGKEIELKYTFNSFKHMKNFSASAFNEMADKPFLLVETLVILMKGALNHDRKVKYTDEDVDAILEELSEKGELNSLLENLMTLMTESGFFKGLQKDKE